MIKSFRGKETKKIFSGEFSKEFPQNIQHRALHRLEMLSNAANINDLRIPPSNCLEALSGDRVGQFSIRVKINTEYVLNGRIIAQKMLNWWIIID